MLNGDKIKENFPNAKWVESKTKTDKLKCSDCQRKLKKDENVVFALDENEKKPMLGVFCKYCSEEYLQELIDSEQHPHDIDDY